MNIVYKQRVLLLLVILLAFSCKKTTTENHVFPDCLSESLEAGVIAFYPFSGGSLHDFSGNNHHLVNNTSAVPAPDRAGNYNCAFLFTRNISNTNEFLVHSNPVFLDGLSAFSVSLWYKPMDTAYIHGQPETLMSRGDGLRCPDRRGQWSLTLYDCRKAVFGRTNSVWDKEIIASRNCKEEVFARTGVWHHAVITYNQNGTQMTIYRNGILQNSDSGSVNCGSGTIASSQDIGDLFFGKDFNGLLDDIIIYDRVLSASEVNQLYQTTPCCQAE